MYVACLVCSADRCVCVCVCVCVCLLPMIACVEEQFVVHCWAVCPCACVKVNMSLQTLSTSQLLGSSSLHITEADSDYANSVVAARLTTSHFVDSTRSTAWRLRTFLSDREE